MSGVTVGCSSACGAREKKRLNCFCESVSANSLHFPARFYSYSWLQSGIKVSYVSLVLVV